MLLDPVDEVREVEVDELESDLQVDAAVVVDVLEFGEAFVLVDYKVVEFDVAVE